MRPSSIDRIGKYTAGMITAKATGKTASSATPPSTKATLNRLAPSTVPATTLPGPLRAAITASTTSGSAVPIATGSRPVSSGDRPSPPPTSPAAPTTNFAPKYSTTAAMPTRSTFCTRPPRVAS